MGVNTVIITTRVIINKHNSITVGYKQVKQIKGAMTKI
jgi:hypothetical protein